ncbi:hypothetical protein ACFU7Z_10680 [Kitasatospora sp. NPDC057518]|uniref:hypothetical protein n=1 Tax=Kitasatospora sp. NPDC057518 TaxID=3346155 RepID=UPI0036CEF925
MGTVVNGSADGPSGGERMPRWVVDLAPTVAIASVMVVIALAQPLNAASGALLGTGFSVLGARGRDGRR